MRKSLIADKDRKMLANVTSMLMGLIVAIGFFGGLLGFSLVAVGVPLALLTAILFFVLYYSITEFKMTLMNIMFLMVILVGFGFLIGGFEIVNPMVTANIEPMGQGVIGAGLIGILMSLANARFGKGK